MNSDSSFPLIEECVRQLTEAYRAGPQEHFIQSITKGISNGRIPLYCALEIAELALNQKDHETVHPIVQALKAHGHEHALLSQMEAWSFLLIDLPEEAIRVLDAALERWQKPYLKSLKEDIQEVCLGKKTHGDEQLRSSPTHSP